MHRRPVSVVRASLALLLHIDADGDVGGSIIVKQVGHAVLTVKLPTGEMEEYLITLPRLRIDGLWYGSPYIELTETSYIQSSTGWLSQVRTGLCATPITLTLVPALDRLQGQRLLHWQVALVQGYCVATAARPPESACDRGNLAHHVARYPHRGEVP